MNFYERITILPITLFITNCIYEIIENGDGGAYNYELDKSLLTWEAMLLY